MAHKHYNFPSLNGLAAFEAAARHMSLKRAASEMNVTPGAVSKHISALEAELGIKLFVRLHRSIELTSEGLVLLDSLKTAFSNVADTLNGLRKGGPTRAVTIGTSSAFAQFWLMPRLGQFWLENQTIIVDHIISDRTHENPISPVDLRVRYGDGQFRGEVCAKLFDDTIIALAAPSLGKKNMSPEELAALPLLSLEGVDSTLTNWADFFALANISTRKRTFRRFNSYVISVQAAMSGQGVVLGWKNLLLPLITSKQLVQLSSLEMDAPESFYLTWSDKKPLPSEAVILRDWLLRS
jgi:LysR family glycine cleavage system transcriptional activator